MLGAASELQGIRQSGEREPPFLMCPEISVPTLQGAVLSLVTCQVQPKTEEPAYYLPRLHCPTILLAMVLIDPRDSRLTT